MYFISRFRSVRLDSLSHVTVKHKPMTRCWVHVLSPGWLTLPTGIQPSSAYLCYMTCRRTYCTSDSTSCYWHICFTAIMANKDWPDRLNYQTRMLRMKLCNNSVVSCIGHHNNTNVGTLGLIIGILGCSVTDTHIYTYVCFHHCSYQCWKRCQSKWK